MGIPQQTILGVNVINSLINVNYFLSYDHFSEATHLILSDTIAQEGAEWEYRNLCLKAIVLIVWYLPTQKQDRVQFGDQYNATTLLL